MKIFYNYQTKLIKEYFLIIGISIVFVGIGIFILRDPLSFEGFFPKLILNNFPYDIKILLYAAGIVDVIIGLGILFLSKLRFYFAILATLHLISIIIFNGLIDVTLRDLGLLGITMYLIFNNIPSWIIKKEQQN